MSARYGAQHRIRVHALRRAAAPAGRSPFFARIAGRRAAKQAPPEIPTRGVRQTTGRPARPAAGCVAQAALRRKAVRWHRKQGFHRRAVFGDCACAHRRWRAIAGSWPPGQSVPGGGDAPLARARRHGAHHYAICPALPPYASRRDTPHATPGPACDRCCGPPAPRTACTRRTRTNYGAPRHALQKPKRRLTSTMLSPAARNAARPAAPVLFESFSPWASVTKR